MSRVGSLARSFVVLGIGNILPKIAGFVTLPILTGCLTTDAYGTYDLINTIVSLLIPLSTLQIQTAVFRYLIDSRDDEASVTEIVSSALAFAVLFSVIVLAGYMVVTGGLDFLVRIWICAYYIFEVLVVVFRQVARGLGLNKIYTFSAGLQSLTQIILCLLLVFGFGFGLVGSVAMVACSTAVACAGLFYRLKIWSLFSLSEVNSACVKRLLRYSWPMVPNQLSLWVMRLSNRLFIAFFCGVTANAMFAAAFKIPQILSLAQSTFQMAWQENASVFSKDADSDEYYSAMFGAFFGLSVGVASLTVAVTPLLFMLLIHGEYQDAYFQIPLLIIAMLFSSLISFYDGICVAREMTKVIGLSALVGALINLSLCAVLIPNLGVTGASIAMLISYGLLFLYRAYDASKYVAVDYEIPKIVASLAIVLVQCFVCARQNLPLDIFNILIGLLLFCVLNRKIILQTTSKIVSKFEKR